MNRRSLLKRTAALSALWLGARQGLAHVEKDGDEPCLGPTPVQPEGPFYPIVDQADSDADLIRVQGHRHEAKGQIIIIEGHVTDQGCNPVEGALVEIWQACESGRYNHPSDPNPAPLDPHFQYWGKAVSKRDGSYRFRTIVPGAYPASEDWMRPPHIHFKISKKGYFELITQMYFEGNKWNGGDKILSKLTPENQKKVVISLQDLSGEDYPIACFPISIEKVI